MAKAICRYNATPFKIPMEFFTKEGKKSFKIIWNLKGPQIPPKFLKNKNKTEGLTLLISKRITKLQYQNSMLLAKDRHIDPWNKIREPSNKTAHLQSTYL